MIYYGDEGFMYGDNTCRFSKTPQNILIVKRPRSLHASILAVDIILNLREKYNAVVYCESDSIGDIKKMNENVEVKSILDIEGDLGEVIDLAISLGGDGTLLWLSHLFQTSVPPVISISMGSLGYMSLFHYSKANEIIDRVMMKRTFAVSLRSRLTLYIQGENGEIIHKCCLNECVFERGDRHCLASIDVYCSGCYFTRVFADGLILATPSGSTAYSMSAGGSIVHPKVSGILFTPICPHTLSFRPLILPDSTELLIHIPESSRDGVQVALDGRRMAELKNGQFAVVKMCSYPLPLVVCPQKIVTDYKSVETDLSTGGKTYLEANKGMFIGKGDYSSLSTKYVSFVCPICGKHDNCKCGIGDQGCNNVISKSEEESNIDEFEENLNNHQFYRKDYWFDSLNHLLDWNSQRSAQIPIDMQEIVSGSKYSDFQLSLRRDNNDGDCNIGINNSFNAIPANRKIVPSSTLEFLKKVLKKSKDEYKHEFHTDNKHSITYLNFKTKFQETIEIKSENISDTEMNNHRKNESINTTMSNRHTNYPEKDSLNTDSEFSAQYRMILNDKDKKMTTENSEHNLVEKKDVDVSKDKPIKMRSKTTPFFTPVKIPEVIILDRKI